MNFAILTLGSRGDVQPYVALGRGLLAAGHDVTLVTAAQFEDFVTGYGLRFAPVDRRFLELTDTDAGQGAFEGGGLKLFKLAMPALRQVLEDSWAAVQGAEAIIYHVKMLGGYHLAEKLGIPAVVAMPLPFYPTSAYTNPLAGRELPAALNRRSYAVNSMGKAPFMGMVNDWRKNTLGLPPRGRFAAEDRLPDGTPVPVMQAYSPHVVPVPADWPPSVTATGYWFLDGDPAWQPESALADFLAAGPPPIYVGFGSMTTRDPEAKSRAVIEAVQTAGCRAVLASGWGGLRASNVPDSVFLIDQAPHDWLFPQVAAVVHHGGAGTTAAGLRAGKPTVVVPFFGDQSFWGRRVFALGAGPEPIPQKKLTAEGLAAAIRSAVGDATIQARAAELGAAIRAEDGVGNAVAFLEAQLRLSPADAAPVASRTPR